MLSIALIGPLPPPSGGMANQTLQLARLLRAEGLEVELVQVNSPYAPRWVGGIPVVRAFARLMRYLPRLWRVAGKVQLFHVMANSGWSWHLFAAPAVWIARARGCPVIVNYRGGEADRFFARSFYWVEKTLKRASAIVVPSAFLKRVFERCGVAVTVVPNIIDVERFSSQRRTERQASGAHLIVTRNLEAIYDVATAIRAFAIVRSSFPGARLSIAGSGPEERDLKTLAKTLDVNDSVTFLGRLDNDKMSELYASADLMLNASLVDNMPISILESLASGVPVVSTNSGGIPDLVEHEKTALLVEPRDYRAMADAAVSLLSDRERAKRLIDQGVRLAHDFSWSRVKKRWLDLYGSVARQALLSETPRTAIRQEK